MTSAGPPRGLSPPLPPSSASSSGSSAGSYLPSPAGWPSLCRLVALRGGGGCRVMPSPYPPPFPFLSPSPLPPLWLRLPCPLSPQIGWACCVGAGVWPLCGPPPGWKLIIRAKMSRACSSGVPLPPSGVGAPPCSPGALLPAPLIPPPPASSYVGGGGFSGLEGCPPSPVSGCARPPGPCLPGGSRGCLIGGSPPCPRCAPMTRAAGWGVPLPRPPLYSRSR